MAEYNLYALTVAGLVRQQLQTLVENISVAENGTGSALDTFRLNGLFNFTFYCYIYFTCNSGEHKHTYSFFKFSSLPPEVLVVFYDIQRLGNTARLFSQPRSPARSMIRQNEDSSVEFH